MSERVSGFLDEEIDSDEVEPLLDALRGDEALKATLSRYGTIAHVIRNGTGSAADPELWKRVSAALEDEPTVLSPRRVTAVAPASVRHRVVSYALAASLAGLALVIGKSFLENSQDFVGAPGGQMVSLGADVRTIPSVQSAQSRFDDYLLAHNQTAQMAGAGGFLPYARLVSVRHDY